MKMGRKSRTHLKISADNVPRWDSETGCCQIVARLESLYLRLIFVISGADGCRTKSQGTKSLLGWTKSQIFFHLVNVFATSSIIAVYTPFISPTKSGMFTSPLSMKRPGQINCVKNIGFKQLVSYKHPRICISISHIIRTILWCIL